MFICSRTGPSKILAASSKSIPCFATLAAFFAASHSNPGGIVCHLSLICERRNGKRERPQRAAIATRSAQARRLLDERARDLLDTLVDARNLRLQLRQPAAVARIRPAVQRDHLSRTFRMFRCRMLLPRSLQAGKLLDDSAQFFLDRQQPRVEILGRNPCVLYCHFSPSPTSCGFPPSLSVSIYGL